MQYVILTILFLTGCHALGEFPAEPAGVDASADLGFDRDVGNDVSMDPEDFGEPADASEVPSCDPASVPDAPEFKLSQFLGGPQDAPQTFQGFGLEAVEHGDHIDFYVAWTGNGDARLLRLHSSDSLEEFDLREVESPEIQDLAIGRSQDELLISVQRSDCVDSPSSMMNQLFYRLSLTDTGDPTPQEAIGPCPGGTSRLNMGAFSKTYNDFTGQSDDVPRWVWLLEPIGIRSVVNPSDAFTTETPNSRVESEVVFSGDRDSRIFSTSGRLVLVSGNFENGQFSNRWWDTETPEPPEDFGILTAGDITGFAHLHNEIYAAAFSNFESDQVELRIYRHDVEEGTLDPVPASSEVLFRGENSSALELAPFEGGFVLSEWLSGAEFFTARITPIEVKFDDDRIQLQPSETATWTIPTRLVRGMDVEAMRDGCDLVVANLSLFGQPSNTKLDMEVFRFPGYFAP